MNKGEQYFNVVAIEGEDSADLLLYGYIGQEDWWRENSEKDLTDLVVVQKLNELEKDYSRINIRINSPGGSVYHGDAIISAIRRSKAEVHTYNDGMAASMAAQIWLTSPNRHMAKNAKLMIHATLSGVIGNAQILREEADILDKYDESLISMIAEHTEMSEAEAKARYIDEYKDNFLTYRDAIEAGFIAEDEEEEYEAENVIKDVEQMNYRQIMNHFDAQPAEKNSFLTELKDTIVGSLRQFYPAPASQNHSNQKDEIMNKDNLVQSLESGAITQDEVAEVLRENNFTVEPVQTTDESEETNLADTITQAVAAAVKPFQEQITNLQAEVQRIGGEAGDTRTNTDAKEDPYKGLSAEEKAAKQKMEKMNAEWKAAGENRERIQIA